MRFISVFLALIIPAGWLFSGCAHAPAALLITGQVAGRPIVKAKKPVYPEWLSKLTEAPAVTLFYNVKPDGTVADKITTIKSSGYEELDKNAIHALKQFEFEALDVAVNQSGFATFRYNPER
jgi:TonB family protein